MGSGVSNPHQFSSSVYEQSSTYYNPRLQDPSLDPMTQYPRYSQSSAEPLRKKVPPSILAIRAEMQKNRLRSNSEGSKTFDQFFEMHSLQMFT